MKLQLYKLDELEAQGDAAIRLSELDEQELARYEQSGLTFLLCRSELKRTLAQESGLAASDIHFNYNEQGKPSCPQLPDLYFNISHSKDLLLIATHDRPIGVDIEKRRPRKESQLAAIAKKFMPEGQRSDFIQRGCPLNEFYDCWCACEALIKMKGMSIWQAKHLPDYLYIDGAIHFTEEEARTSIQVQILNLTENDSAACAFEFSACQPPQFDLYSHHGLE